MNTSDDQTLEERRNTAVGRTITLFRNARSISQASLSAISRIDAVRLRNIERGVIAIRLTELTEITLVLNTSTSEFLAVADNLEEHWREKKVDAFKSIWIVFSRKYIMHLLRSNRDINEFSKLLGAKVQQMRIQAKNLPHPVCEKPGNIRIQSRSIRTRYSRDRYFDATQNGNSPQLQTRYTCGKC